MGVRTDRLKSRRPDVGLGGASQVFRKLQAGCRARNRVVEVGCDWRGCNEEGIGNFRKPAGLGSGSWQSEVWAVEVSGFAAKEGGGFFLGGGQAERVQGWTLLSRAGDQDGRARNEQEKRTCRGSEVVPRSSGLVKAELEDTGWVSLRLTARNGGNRGGQIFERDLSRIPGPGRLVT